ncbi:hypothetical protein OC846_006050 [Tilletia horrida]|uniref:Phospholipid/glycerol acyltransferase domain-containing protein n=1 Tax=Tilletia horrida TaxID=155126 RepID=A0AAN6GJM3_9BASI|nr:hypothetical protein OC846_006050 [Tilletia horrida]KAK0547847.1 hypothetical protein OC845_003869 [Tilletia horrida]
MEKFSRYRDPGSGIQVFLPPVLPVGSRNPLVTIFTPLAVLLGLVRAILLLATILLWSIFGVTLGNLSSEIQANLTSLFGRVALFIIGYAWISPEIVLLRNRGRATNTRPVAYAPGTGDVIVTNWSSWVEVLWLAISFAPVFALPVVDGNDYDAPPAPERKSGRPSGAKNLRQRAGGVASDATDGPKRKILGFRRVNWIIAARAVGQLPTVKTKNVECVPLDQICADANGPVVLFPEGVTSNNRALLRPAGCFPQSWRQAFKLTAALRLGGNSPKLFLASFKHGPPTAGSVSSVVSVSSSFASPWPHVWSVCCSLTFNRDFQIRLLHPAESPTSASFIGDAAAAAMAREDPVSDACLTIISSLSRLRRTEIGWEDKESFMQIYKRR